MKPVDTNAASTTQTELDRWTEERSALRRVAELGAAGGSQAAVFDAVALEACQLLGGHFTALLRYEPDGQAVIVAMHGSAAVGHVMYVGMALSTDGDGIVQRVRRSATAVHIDSYEGVPGWNAATARDLGLTSGVGAPIITEGRVWGAITVLSGARPLPPHAETRLGLFAALVATAIANTQARTQLQKLADEQAALRRVAELVARGKSLDEVFTAIAAEASILLDGLAGVLLRYDSDDVGVVVAACNSPVPLGLRVPLHAGTGTGDVRRTGKPARVDTFENTAVAKLARELGVVASVAAPITVEGRIWGTLSTTSSGPAIPTGTEDRLMQFAELAAAAIANAENKAKLTASRARVVATADETRRRLQRDVHDSAQQRLVHSIIALKLARTALAAGETAAPFVDEALHNAEQASRELRDVVRGVLPSSLTRGGLRSGIRSLVADLPLPVDVRVPPSRPAAHTETTAYFIVAEALTNVVKHARATRAIVQVTIEPGSLEIDVRDDGIGGADADRGTGLTGLLDRVDAAEGTLTVTSPAGLGTTLHAALPLDQLP